MPTDPAKNRFAIRVDDHGLEHLDFEDPTPVEGVPGAVAKCIWDSETYRAEAFEEDRIVADFEGPRLRGRYAIFRTRDGNWLVHLMRER